VTANGDISELPLYGKTIVVTRPQEQTKEFTDLLERYGARVIHFPAIVIASPSSWTECDSSFTKLSLYSGIIFTSANAVEYFFRRAKERKVMDQLKQCRMFAVGDRTKLQIEQYGFAVEKFAKSSSAAQLAKQIVETSAKGEKFLFPKGDLAMNDIEEILSSHEINVDSVTVYFTQEPPFNSERKALIESIEEGTDLITFFSPSSVNNVFRRVSPAFITAVGVAVIGMTTADAARRAGMNVVLVAPDTTAEVFAESICRYFTS
jgi:uroporphyrinogen III methyltransferase/synthase